MEFNKSLDIHKVVQTIGEGVAEVREALGEEPYEEIYGPRYCYS